MKKKATLIMIVLLVLSFIVMEYDSRLIKNAAVLKTADNIASGVFIICILGLFLLWTRDGRRLKNEFIDPMIKPTGVETDVWDAETGKPLYGNGGAQNQAETESSGKSHSRKHPYLIIIVLIIAVLVIADLFVNMTGGVQAMYDQSAGMEKIINGAANGDGAAAAEGGRQLLGGFLADLKNILFLFILIAVCIGAGYIVYRIRNKTHHNKFSKEDKDDDFWDS